MIIFNFFLLYKNVIDIINIKMNFYILYFLYVLMNECMNFFVYSSLYLIYFLKYVYYDWLVLIL